MKVLILAAGYGTRLARDLEAEGVQGHYAHLVGVAKPLLPVGGIPLISHWLALLGACPDAQGDVYVVVRAVCIVFRSLAQVYNKIVTLVGLLSYPVVEVLIDLYLSLLVC